MCPGHNSCLSMRSSVYSTVCCNVTYCLFSVFLFLVDSVINVNFTSLYEDVSKSFRTGRLGTRTANGTALCHWVQLCHYFVSHSGEICHHNPLCCFSSSVYCCSFRYRLNRGSWIYPRMLSLLFFEVALFTIPLFLRRRNVLWCLIESQNLN
jgi:hypothetical protein